MNEFPFNFSNLASVSKALDGAKSMIDGMLQRDEIQQREIAQLREQVDGLQYDLSSTQRTLATVCEHRDLLERRAKTTEMVMKQRDEALIALAAMREERNRLREQVGSLHESREKIISDRNFVQGQLELERRLRKAQADYRDLRLRMLKA